MRVLDSHLHLWDPDVLEYTWLEGPLKATFSERGFSEEQVDVQQHAAIFVQAGTEPGDFLNEVRWVESVSAEVGIVAIVAGAQLDLGAATAEHLGSLAQHQRVVGVRHILQGSDAGTAMLPAFRDGARMLVERGWSFDACVSSTQISEVTALADAVPELPIVLDHLGKPEVGTAQDPLRPKQQWLQDIAALAQHPQVFCKLSGLPAESGGVWTDEQIAPYLDAALETFGPERLMWGSDWPVSGVDAENVLPGSRRRWLQTIIEWAHSRDVDPEALFWGNAHRFYGVGLL